MSKNNLWWLVLAILILVGLFYLLKPKTNTPTPIPAASSIESTSSAQPSANAKTFDLVIKGKKLQSGPETIQVTEGNQVTINIISDEDEEFHIHGYDKSVDLQPNKPAQLNLTANLTGRFAYELEKSKTDLGALEVQPK